MCPRTVPILLLSTACTFGDPQAIEADATDATDATGSSSSSSSSSSTRPTSSTTAAEGGADVTSSPIDTDGDGSSGPIDASSSDDADGSSSSSSSSSSSDASSSSGADHCAHSPCDVGEALAYTCDPCVTEVCSAAPTCCDFENCTGCAWDNLCVVAAADACDC